MEIRGGTGGDKAAILQEMFQMYTRFCESKGWKVDVTDFSEGTIGGYKGNYLHRDRRKRMVRWQIRKRGSCVQRMPKPKPRGRVHLSSHCGCAPEADGLMYRLISPISISMRHAQAVQAVRM